MQEMQIGEKDGDDESNNLFKHAISLNGFD